MGTCTKRKRKRKRKIEGEVTDMTQIMSDELSDHRLNVAQI